MPRDYKIYLQDIIAAIQKIEEYTKDLDLKSFNNNDLVVDGVIRNLEIVGEAAKNVPKEVQNKHKQIEWQKVAGLRDILIHQYFGVDVDILWDIIRNKLPDLKTNILAILSQ